MILSGECFSLDLKWFNTFPYIWDSVLSLLFNTETLSILFSLEDVSFTDLVFVK